MSKYEVGRRRLIPRWPVKAVRFSAESEFLVLSDRYLDLKDATTQRPCSAN